MAKKNTTKKSSKEAVVEEPKTIEEIKEEVIAETKDTESENTKEVEEEVEAVKPIVEDTNKNVNEEKTETKHFNSHMFGYSWNGVEMDW